MMSFILENIFYLCTLHNIINIKFLLFHFAKKCNLTLHSVLVPGLIIRTVQMINAKIPGA